MPTETNQPRSGWYRIDTKLLARTDLNSDEKLFLAVIADGYRLSIRSIAERTGVSKSKAGRILAGLAKRGIVKAPQCRTGQTGEWSIVSDRQSAELVPTGGTRPENSLSQQVGQACPNRWDKKRPNRWDTTISTRPLPYHVDGVSKQSMTESGKPNNGTRKRPTTGHIHLEDLTENGRLLSVFDRAAGAGFVDRSEHGRLMVFALAACCLRAGKNPASMFAAMITRREFSRVSIDDEDAARIRLRAIDELETFEVRKAGMR